MELAISLAKLILSKHHPDKLLLVRKINLFSESKVQCVRNWVQPLVQWQRKISYSISYSKRVRPSAFILNARREPAINPDDAIITSSDKRRTFAIIVQTNCIDWILISMQHMMNLCKLKQE